MRRVIYELTVIVTTITITPEQPSAETSSCSPVVAAPAAALQDGDRATARQPDAETVYVIYQETMTVFTQPQFNHLPQLRLGDNRPQQW
jgi:hypothetical protein